ncbi:hypothetical protein TUM18999_44910 [Pseudomonas tohonis]|nr:hypothetical protein TUM18999_44910 [Pseudomonas tohonis]
MKVVSVELVADSQLVIKLDNGGGKTESLWGVCTLGELGYDGVEAGAPIRPDERSQAIAYRACKDAVNESLR